MDRPAIPYVAQVDAKDYESLVLRPSLRAAMVEGIVLGD